MYNVHYIARIKKIERQKCQGHFDNESFTKKIYEILVSRLLLKIL